MYPKKNILEEKLRIARTIQKNEKFKDYLEKQSDENEKDNIVFEITRKILIATYQHIVYNQYLPKVLGEQYMREFGLYSGNLVIVDCEPSSFIRESGSNTESSSYDASSNPTLYNEFSAFAYRYQLTKKKVILKYFLFL